MQLRHILFLLAWVFLFPHALHSETFMDFDFVDGEVSQGFNGWWYSPYGDSSCAIYNAASQSKMCSDPDNDGYVRSFYYYYNGYNNDHMGWMRWGYIDAGDVAIKGKSLKVTFTGGAYDKEGVVTYSGLEVHGKKQYDDHINNNDNPYADRNLPGDLTIYFKTGGKYHPFQEFIGKDRLSVWILPPEESTDTLENQQRSSASSRPDGQFSWYPFVDNSNGDHYYHDHSNINMGGWIHLIFDAHPHHNNAGDTNPYSYYRAGGRDYPGDGVSYFNNTHGFALRAYIANNLPSPTTIYIDELEVYMVSQPENDETIAGIGVGYDPGEKIFDISFSDKYRCGDCQATYEVRYSFSPITNINFTAAKLCKVINYDRSRNNDSGIIHKPHSGYNRIWAALNVFDEDKALLTEGATIYFAVKDISDRSNLTDRDTFELETVEVPGLGAVRRVDLVKTIDYEIFPLFKRLYFTDEPLPSGHHGEPYLERLPLKGGVKPILFEFTSGILPDGLSLSADGTISGTPVTTGVFNFRIKASESSSFQQVTSKDFEITMYEPESCTDRIDNDADLLIDCMDPGCFADASCSTLLVDFADPHVFGLTDWNTVIDDIYTGYVDDGPGGMTNTIGSNGSYNFQGVTGISRDFITDERLLVYWYNHSTSAITFTPRISFDDSNRPGSDGTWYPMSELTVEPGKTAMSEFVIDGSNAGRYSVVNVNVNYSNHRILICDKILLSTAGEPIVPIAPKQLRISGP